MVAGLSTASLSHGTLTADRENRPTLFLTPSSAIFRLVRILRFSSFPLRSGEFRLWNSTSSSTKPPLFFELQTPLRFFAGVSTKFFICFPLFRLRNEPFNVYGIDDYERLRTPSLRNSRVSWTTSCCVLGPSIISQFSFLPILHYSRTVAKKFHLKLDQSFCAFFFFTVPSWLPQCLTRLGIRQNPSRQ